jgi:hypothetical protein
MSNNIDLKDIDSKIQSIKKTAEYLSHTYSDFPAIKRNTARLLASVKMLEINISDIADL